MFPYPSGRIHMGHVRNYTMGDVIAPLPAHAGSRSASSDGLGRVRNAGRKCGHGAQRPPGRVDLGKYPGDARTAETIGFALDWSREFATCDPAYYGQEQALFLDLFEAGMVYRKEATSIGIRST
jgi:leucyl-tRNA synthetase